VDARDKRGHDGGGVIDYIGTYSGSLRQMALRAPERIRNHFQQQRRSGVAVKFGDSKTQVGIADFGAGNLSAERPRKP
jgi:hypothetical protein